MSSTTNPALRSFVKVEPGSEFPIQNLPYGVFRGAPDEAARVGVAIGNYVLDVALLEERGFFQGTELRGQRVFQQPTLNALMALGPAAWRAAREQISRLLRADVPLLRDNGALRDQALLPLAEVELCLPCTIGDYTDFYASRYHAENVGRIFRGPAAALPPNYLHLPIGYHGRSSSIVVSGNPVRRPSGQSCPEAGKPPVYGPTRELDFELELGLLIGRGNELGRSISTARAANVIFGLVLVNDWSARDVQRWEYTPLGPFLGKNFATTISPWVVPLEALEPFRCDGPAQDPPPLSYLQTRGAQAFDIHLEVGLQTANMETAEVICRSNARHLYWSAAQMVAHHTVGGCDLRSGDLLATGTISGPTPESAGSLLELAEGGQRPLQLDNGEQRTFLEDGDAVTLRGYCDAGEYRLGFGPCEGVIETARPG